MNVPVSNIFNKKLSNLKYNNKMVKFKKKWMVEFL